MFRKKSLKWITRYNVASFLDKLAQGIFLGKIDYHYFCQSAVPHTKKFKLKKSLQRIRICKVLQFWSKLGPNCRVFPTGAENKEESSAGQKFAHSLSQYQEKSPSWQKSPSKCLFSSTKYQIPCFNPIKISFLGFWLLPLLLLYFILTLYVLYSQVMLILILIIVPCLENVVNFEKG